MMLLDERHRIVASRGEVADIKIYAVVLSVGHQRVITLKRCGLVRIVGRVVTMVANQQLVLVGDRCDAFGHGQSRAGCDALHAQSPRHLEAVLDVFILHAVLHVVAEQRKLNAGVVELLGDGFPGMSADAPAPLRKFLLDGLPLGGLFGRNLWTSSTRRSGAATGPAENRHRRRSCQSFAVVRHQLGFTQPDLDVCLDNCLRIGAGDPIEAVGNGANLNAAELRIDPLGAVRPAQRRRRHCQPAQVPSGELHF